MKLEVNINKRYAIMIIASVLLLGVSIFVYAAIGDEAPNPGHVTSEIAGFPDCLDNQFLKHNAGTWTCEDLSAASLDLNDCHERRESTAGWCFPGVQQGTECDAGYVVVGSDLASDHNSGNDQYCVKIKCCKLG